MTDLLSAIDEAKIRFRQSEETASAAARHLRHCRAELDQAKDELMALLDELHSGRSRYPLFERIEIGTNGDGTAVTHDEHQRGPTESPAATEEANPPANKTRAKKGGSH